MKEYDLHREDINVLTDCIIDYMNFGLEKKVPNIRWEDQLQEEDERAKTQCQRVWQRLKTTPSSKAPHIQTAEDLQWVNYLNNFPEV